MGTSFKITLYAPNEATAARAARAAFERVSVLDAMMTDYRPTSELMRLCAKAGGTPVPVSAELFTVLERAQQVARRSGGALDITVGPVVRLWRRARRTRDLPDVGELAQALALVGYDKVRLDPRARTVQLAKAGMQLDLGGIAKGYAADQALAVLKKHGLSQALVVAGGEVVVGSPPPDAGAWVVGIASLENPLSKPRCTLLLHDAAVSTSGDTEQYVEIGGKRYSHIVDPHTGLGLVGRSSVTVVAPDGLTADSLTKVVAVLGPEKGFPIVEETPGAAGFMVRKTDRGEETFVSPRFPKIPQHR
jgi:thiamine biosynthesis lipoprotein